MGRTGRAGRTGVSITFMAREDWKHAKELIPILEQGEQEVPKSLVDMADRYAAMMKKKLEEVIIFLTKIVLTIFNWKFFREEVDLEALVVLAVHQAAEPTVALSVVSPVIFQGSFNF